MNQMNAAWAMSDMTVRSDCTDQKKRCRIYFETVFTQKMLVNVYIYNSFFLVLESDWLWYSSDNSTPIVSLIV